MTRVENAITWSGSGTVFNLFVVWPQLPAVEPNLAFAAGRPEKVTIFHIEDEFNVLNGSMLSEYDAKFRQTPADLEGYLTSCLEGVMRDGARAAWFGFEASFGFDALLAKSIADQIYAVADATGSIALALHDAELQSSAWANRVIRIGETLRSPARPVRARVNNFTSLQIDLVSFVPKHPDDVRVSVRMVVEPDDQEGEETFEVMVCTPSNLAKWQVEHGPVIGRHSLIVKSWDWPEIREFLIHRVESEVAPTWERLRERIGRIARWEYEDFTPVAPTDDAR